MRRVSLLLLPLCFFLNLAAQIQIKVIGTEEVPELARLLIESDETIRDDVKLVEEALDLVEAWTTDSVLSVNRQHHIGFAGFMARTFGRYWEKLDDNKQKFIGTCSRKYKIYDGIAKEVDMNIFLMPHLKPYVEMTRKAFDTAFEKGRSEKHYRYDNPAYPSPEELKFKELGYLTVECEGTPPENHREELAKKFLPMKDGKHDLMAQGNFGVKYPSFGLYGAWCMDCNHNCRPEIHPVEWMWWLDFSPDRPGGPNAKSWMVGLLRDGSQRFEDWSLGPLTGQISIPVVFPLQSKALTISIEHLVHDQLHPNKIGTLPVPTTAVTGNLASIAYTLELRQGRSLPLNLSIQGLDTAEGVRIWLNDFRLDQSKGLIMGKLSLAVAAQNLYTCRITIDHQ